MAGDWIKMRQDLSEDPAVVVISSETELDEDSVVGKLHRLWCWADKHTTDGRAPAISEKWVDRYVACPGFSKAMQKAGWLEFDETGIIFPSFDKHNGQTAKTRCEAALRQRLSRKNRDKGVTGVTRTSIPRSFVRHVLVRDGYRCVYCGTQSDAKQEASRKKLLSIDHILPESRGGSCAVENLACACKECNNEKNDRTPSEWGVYPSFLLPGVTYKNGQLSQKSCDKSVTREEKRREEEKENPLKSPKGDDAFERFWSSVHQRVGKEASRRAFSKATARLSSDRGCAKPEAAEEITRAMERFARSPASRPTDHSPIHPATWLNQGRYEDDPATWGSSNNQPEIKLLKRQS